MSPLLPPFHQLPLRRGHYSLSILLIPPTPVPFLPSFTAPRQWTTQTTATSAFVCAKLLVQDGPLRAAPPFRRMQSHREVPVRDYHDLYPNLNLSSPTFRPLFRENREYVCGTGWSAKVMQQMIDSMPLDRSNTSLNDEPKINDEQWPEGLNSYTSTIQKYIKHE